MIDNIINIVYHIINLGIITSKISIIYKRIKAKIIIII